MHNWPSAVNSGDIQMFSLTEYDLTGAPYFVSSSDKVCARAEEKEKNRAKADAAMILMVTPNSVVGRRHFSKSHLGFRDCRSQFASTIRPRKSCCAVQTSIGPCL